MRKRNRKRYEKKLGMQNNHVCKKETEKGMQKNDVCKKQNPNPIPTPEGMPKKVCKLHLCKKRYARYARKGRSSTYVCKKRYAKKGIFEGCARHPVSNFLLTEKILLLVLLYSKYVPRLRPI
jgi:hypothetical protein